MSQTALAAAVGFSESQLSRLEKNQRLPNIEMIATIFAPALGLGEEPHLAARLVELAALARGERPPDELRITRQVRQIVHEEQTLANNLPIPPTELLGRDRELDQLGKRILNHSGRLFTLLGPPGVGKTRLALALATHLQMLFADGARFIPLATVTDPAQVASAIVSGLELTETGGKRPISRLIEHLRRREMLLVLDNFEQIADAAPLVAQLLQECGGLSVLVTSRVPLRLRAEQRQRIATLDVAHAIELFTQRARAINPDFAAPADLLANICRSLDCLPLAIELVAARVDIFTPEQLLARLQEQALDLLTDGPRDLPPHQQTLRRALDGSYALLTSAEQHLFRSAALFAGGFTIDALKAIAYPADAQHRERAATALRLQSLVSKSLVQPQLAEDTPRFSLLETMRAYGLERLASAGEETAQRAAHAAYFLHLAQRAAHHMQSEEKKPWLDCLSQEHDNLRAALTWGLDADPPLALRLAIGLEEFWATRGHDYEARRWLRHVLDANPAASLERGAALLAAGMFARRQADYGAAERDNAEALAIFRQQNDSRSMARGLRQDGWLQYDLHRKGETLAAFTQSLDLYRALDDEANIADLLLCLVHVLVGQPEAQSLMNVYLDESLSIYTKLGQRPGIAQVAQYQGEIAMSAGDYATAMRHFSSALAIWREVDARLHVAWNVCLVGESAWLQGDLPTARTAYGEGQQIFQELGNKDGLMIVLHHLGQVARKMGNLIEARQLYEQSLTMSHELNNQHMTARCLAGLGSVALQQSDLPRACALLVQAQALFATLPPFLTPADRAEFDELIHAAHQEHPSYC